MEVDWNALPEQAKRALYEDRMDDAVAIFQRIVDLVPDAGNNWFNLAYAKRGARDFKGALAAYRRAIQVGGLTEPEAAHINRAIIFKDDLGQNREAERELQKALRLAPADQHAWFNLGLLYETEGRKDDARAAHHRAVVADPLCLPAHARLATLEDDPERAIANLVAVLRRGPLQGGRAVDIEFALASALDRAARYDEAFMVASKANARAASLRRPRFRYNQREHAALIDALIAAYPGRPAIPPQDDDLRPVFLVGMFRSGSTLCENRLARHPAITGGGELDAIPVMVRDHLQPYPASAVSLDPATRARLRSTYLAALDRVDRRAAHVTDKRSDNFLHLGLIKSLFPGTPIVHTARDPLDVAVSTYFLDFAEHFGYTTSLEDIGHYLAQYLRLMAHWQQVFGSDIITVHYEDMVSDPEAALAPALAAWGLTGASSQPQKSATIRTPSTWAVRGKLHSRSAGRWKHYEKHLEPVRRALGR